MCIRDRAEEGADPDTCVAGALLHDLVYLPKNHPDSARTAALAAALVPELSLIHLSEPTRPY